MYPALKREQRTIMNNQLFIIPFYTYNTHRPYPNYKK